jgi:hypothetical protein
MPKIGTPEAPEKIVSWYKGSVAVVVFSQVFDASKAVYSVIERPFLSHQGGLNEG